MLICYHFENSQKLIHRIEVVAAIRTRGGELGVVQRWLPVLSGSPPLSPCNNVRAHRQTVAPKRATLSALSGSGTQAVEQTETEGEATDAQHARQWLVFFQTYPNIARPHMSLRQQLLRHVCKRCGALCPRW